MNDTRAAVYSGSTGRARGAAAAARPGGAAGTGLGAEQVARLHAPVLPDRCLDLLAPALAGPGAPERPVLIDCTLGMGGHARAALERFEDLTLIGIDRDPEAIALASSRLARYGERFRAVRATYDRVDAVAREAAEASGRRDGVVDAVLMDLGVSSLQLDRAERGFSYARSAPLDMRMDQSGGRTAQDLLDTAEERELTRILRAYGEERFASRIAAGIVRRREAGDPVRSTDALADLVRGCVPAAARRTGGHPAKRTFQALRVAVNTELELLERAVPRALNSVRVGGRVVIESYQSLEDRIVKRAFAAGASPSAPQGLPVVPQDALPYIELATRGAVRADDDEVAANPRSASVRLRAATRIRPAAEAPAPEPAPRPRPHPARTPAQGRRGR
ncbi:MAG: 16S rRNA (cytosine(1402)-N(4))-methyltransferase [Actinomyces sp.]|nr:MAG: 16S rRNA (cytosine(1402)-N(4))-methyltransferase [Actinomyces sp.]